MSETLSLFHIEQTLVDLMAMRDEPDLQPEEREAIEGQITEYVLQHVAKVDHVRGYLKQCEMFILAAKAEAQAQLTFAARWEARRDSLKALVKGAMETFGKKRLEGQTGAFSLRGNGGKQPVVIDNPELVPDEYCVYEIALPGRHWELFSLWSNQAELGYEWKRVPRASLIESALQKACSVCVARSSITSTSVVVCAACGGSGRQGVPGAHLEPRGSHVRVE